MKLKITIRHENEKNKLDEFKKFINIKIQKLEKLLEKNNTPCEIRFILSVEKFRQKAEIFLNSGKFKFTSSVESDDMMYSIENSIDNIVRQIRKRIDKRITSKKRLNHSGKIPSNKYNKVDIKVEKTSSKPMSIDEAKLQLKISSKSFVSFHNSETNEMNVLYENDTNNYILITP